MPLKAPSSRPPLTDAQRRAIVETARLAQRCAEQYLAQLWAEVQHFCDFHGPYLARCAPYFEVAFPAEGDAEARHAAARQVAERLSPALRNPAARMGLRRLAEQQRRPPADLMRDWLLPTGLVLAGCEVSQPQKIRLGRTWVRGEDGEVAPVPPGDLPAGDLMVWLRQRAYHLTEGLLQEVWEAGSAPVPDRGSDPTRSSSTPPLEDDRVGALDALVAAEDLQDQRRLLLLLRAAASRREREVLDLLDAGVPWEDLPAIMHLSPQAVATLRKRLAKKAQKILANL